MAIEPVSLGTFAGLPKILEYLRPNRSPYLVAVFTVSISFLLVKDSSEEMSGERMLYLLVPMISFYVIFSLVPLLLFRVRKDAFGPDESVEMSDQFKFSRSVFISVVVISIFILTNNFQGLNWVFYASYLMLILYLVVFSMYLLTREVMEESIASNNLIQIALINSLIILLVANYAPAVEIEDGSIALDCTATLPIEHDAVLESESAVEGEPPMRELSDLSDKDCLATELALIKGSSYQNILVKGSFLLETKVSFDFVVFLASYALAVIYFLFWFVRMGSKIKIKVIE